MTYHSASSMLSVFLGLSFLIGLSTGLECYVCTNQEGNIEKCLSTIKTCEYGEDTCLTEVRWGSTPYWSQGAEKQYYVTKKCSNRTHCEDRRKQFVHHCHRIWYEDWKCAECCQGDRCNYYVVLGAPGLRFSWLVIAASVITTVCVYFSKDGILS
ncbi:hypothetical protein Ocin01_06292 [Orchesella cincta]|uniref:Uncharacterized protein n=1 Tax=Orchesella cincta TaxID=48709 RepID=A0A1D2N532_ORCCI|nr:hypothetical protein Ocin01_06292 [Orchesella cincta]